MQNLTRLLIQEAIHAREANKASLDLIEKGLASDSSST
jgi:hypothetical protein